MATTVPPRLGAPVAKSRQPINRKRPLFDPPIVKRAVRDAFAKLSPRHMMRNPVMFVVLVGAFWTTVSLIVDLTRGTGTPGFTFQLALWLWFTVLFANFAEAMAEGRGKAQAESLRATRELTQAKKLENPSDHLRFEVVRAPFLRAGDVVLCTVGNTIPADGEVIDGVASVDESAITGESAPVIRESGGERSAVTGGTKVLSDWLVIRVTKNPGETFIDRMIALVESATRQKTPNEIALTILLVRPDGRVPARRRDAAAVRDLFRWRGGGADPDRPAGLPHPHDDRWAVVGDRHRRDGPARAAQRDRDERSRGRSGG